MAIASWGEYWDEVGPTVVALVGVLLLVFPEPATSAFGIGLMLLGGIWWYYECDR